MVEIFDFRSEINDVILFEIELSQNNGLKIRTIASLLRFAETLEDNFDFSRFSNDDIDKIRDKCGAFARKYGYKEDIFSSACVYEYSVDGAVRHNDFLLESSRLFTFADDIPPKNTLLDVRKCVNDRGIAAATVKDGRVVSVAAANIVEDHLEITVETVPDYRRKGFSTSNVALLMGELQKRKMPAIYKCKSTNIASMKVAKKLELKKEKITYVYRAVRQGNI